MLTGANTLEEKVKGFEAGVDDYLVKPFQPIEFQARVKSLIRRGVASPPTSISKPTSKVIALCSLRGGVGVSTLAINLALSLAHIWQMPTALLDLALTAGQDAVMLNLPLRHTWGNLANIHPTEIKMEQVERAMLLHPSSSLRVLAAPHLLEQGEKITADHVSRVITLLKEQYHYLVLDLSHDLRETTLAGLDAADQIMVVTTPELASVYVTARTLDTFESLGYSRDNIYLILNSTFQHHGLTHSDIKAALKHPLNLVIPFASDLLINAINTGLPVMTQLPEHPFGVLLEDLAYYLSKDEHKLSQPPTPTPAWKRVNQRLQQHRKR